MVVTTKTSTKPRPSAASHRPKLSSNSWNHSGKASGSKYMDAKDKHSKKESRFVPRLVNDGTRKKILGREVPDHGDIVGHRKYIVDEKSPPRGKITFNNKRNYQSPDPGLRLHLKRGEADRYKSNLALDGSLVGPESPIPRRRCITPSHAFPSNPRSEKSDLVGVQRKGRPQSAPRTSQSTEGLLDYEPEKYKGLAQVEYQHFIGQGNRKRIASEQLRCSTFDPFSTASSSTSILLPATHYIFSSGSSMEMPIRPRALLTSNSSGVSSSLTWS